jgi:sensor histidine kinase regulating citrate/malate metabolism
LYEIIEILGILTTNAAEYYKDVAGDKIIKLTIQETLHNLYIEVSNKSKKFSVSEIERMFKYGYSTKGTERGIGLPRIKELAEKTDSDIIVDNKVFDEENWLSFTIVIPKEEERRVAI